MPTAAGLKDLYQRLLRAMLRRPELARATAQARGRLGDGLTCEVEEAAWRTRVDQPQEDGGAGSAPHPGQMMRASILACLATGYRVWGARLDVAIDDIEIDVLCETDVRGQMGIADVTIGWQRIVIEVCVTSRAAEADVRRVVETTDRLSPMLANLSPAIERVHHLRVIQRVPPKGGLTERIVPSMFTPLDRSRRQPAGSNDDKKGDRS
jgi:uncharacterized OsmC-like protein